MGETLRTPSRPKMGSLLGTIYEMAEEDIPTQQSRVAKWPGVSPRACQRPSSG